ncbi:hypothetical protein Vretifemale_15471 [Volvox reticuliferus]|uniref:PDZ domain-containing protein n=1 Tax=Volvox reticuliferus TaxID=1737510 RepID=A0A8J4CTX4_9CHLO|nr:hypothetical protein Vretifemale_15471 [Volvox reticuliferus]
MCTCALQPFGISGTSSGLLGLYARTYTSFNCRHAAMMRVRPSQQCGHSIKSILTFSLTLLYVPQYSCDLFHTTRNKSCDLVPHFSLAAFRHLPHATCLSSNHMHSNLSTIFPTRLPKLTPSPRSVPVPIVLSIKPVVSACRNPFGFGHTLTSGVISALNRDIRSQLGTTIPGGIQTDASINPGNSGGPLLDSTGRVIGINTAIFTPTGSSAGIGFAIPVDMVKVVIPQLIQNGKVVRPSLDAQIASDSVAQRLKVSKGALIQMVTPGGAADKAGLLPTRRGLSGIILGDVIQAVNGRPVNSGGDLLVALDSLTVGDTAKLQLVRSTDQGLQELELSVVLGKDK